MGDRVPFVASVPMMREVIISGTGMLKLVFTTGI
jgi:hypothetical protein